MAILIEQLLGYNEYQRFISRGRWYVGDASFSILIDAIPPNRVLFDVGKHSKPIDLFDVLLSADDQSSTED